MPFAKEDANEVHRFSVNAGKYTVQLDEGQGLTQTNLTRNICLIKKMFQRKEELKTSFHTLQLQFHPLL